MRNSHSQGSFHQGQAEWYTPSTGYGANSYPAPNSYQPSFMPVSTQPFGANDMASTNFADEPPLLEGTERHTHKRRSAASPRCRSTHRHAFIGGRRTDQCIWQGSAHEGTAGARVTQGNSQLFYLCIADSLSVLHHTDLVGGATSPGVMFSCLRCLQSWV